jgi:hypothetical protein
MTLLPLHFMLGVDLLEPMKIRRAGELPLRLWHSLIQVATPTPCDAMRRLTSGVRSGREAATSAGVARTKFIGMQALLQTIHISLSDTLR